MKRSLLILLTLIVLLFALVACAKNNTDAESSDTSVETTSEATTKAQDTSSETTADTTSEAEKPTEPLPSIAELDLSDYSVVVPNKSTSVTNVAKKLCTGIRTNTQVSVGYMSEVLIGESGPVILLGDTKYPESAEAKALLTEEYSFVIKVFDGGRIAICATEDGVLVEAVEYFLENCISNDNATFLLDDDSSLYRRIDLDGLDNATLLSINGSTKYGIVYPENADSGTKKIIERFAGEITEKTDISLSLNKDSAVASDFEIVIGDTNRSDTDTMSVGDSGWRISLDGKKIFINGSTMPILADVLNMFTSEYLQVDGEFVYIDKELSATETKTGYDREGWEIAAPAYEGGTLALVYNNGTGRYNSNIANESNMMLVSETSATDFNAYLAKLENNGYELITKTVIDDNIYAQYEKGYSLIYAYYTHCFTEARIIDDCASVSEDEFEYIYEVKEGETFDVTQYGIMSTHDGTWPTNGMFYVIKLADNSVVLVDGGNGDQATNAAADGVYNYLRELTGIPEGEKIRVAALYYTHPHGDHVNMSPKLVSRHGDQLVIERVMCNFPNENVPVGDDKWSGTIVKFLGSLKSKYPDVKMIQLHRGQKIELGGATFTALYTQEDTVSATTGVPSFAELNNYTAVVMMEANGVKTLFLGDVGNNSEREEVMDLLLIPFSAETLKCDIVQVAHHGYNRLDRVYSTINAEYALFSTFDIADKTELSYNQKIIYNMLLENGLTDDTIFFQGRKSWNLSMLDGDITVTYDDIRGYDEGYLEHLASCAGHSYSVAYGKTFE